MPAWPHTRDEPIEEQSRLGALEPTSWLFKPDAKVGGVFLCFARGKSGPGQAGDPAWTAACVGRGTTVVRGRAGAPYEPGLLVLREGTLLEAAVRALPELPDVLLVDATGRDHPRRAGLSPAWRDARTADGWCHASPVGRRGRVACGGARCA